MTTSCLTPGHKLVWFGQSLVVWWLGKTHRTAVGKPIYPDNCWEFLGFSTSGPFLDLQRPLDCFKIGFIHLRSSVVLILGHLYPNFDPMSPQNVIFWSFFTTYSTTNFYRKVRDQKFWVQKNAESLLFQNK